MYNKKNNENKVSFLLPAHMSQEGKKNNGNIEKTTFISFLSRKRLKNTQK